MRDKYDYPPDNPYQFTACGEQDLPALLADGWTIDAKGSFGYILVRPKPVKETE